MIISLLFFLVATTIEQVRASEGIIISGGYGLSAEYASSSVEVFDPTTGQSCELPSLPVDRHGHTMDGLTICGGMDIASLTGTTDTNTTCITFSSGEWVTSHSLAEVRLYHSSWATAEGIMLVGGFLHENTTEIVTEAEYDGEPSFDLQYSGNTCSIPDQTTETLIITGGRNASGVIVSRVARYDTLGFVEELPSINIERWDHGCGAYMKEDGAQVLLVTGGYNKGNSDISSTELLPSPSSAWVMASSLPRALYGMKGVTVAGVLYITGGFGFSSNTRNEVYSWTDDEWLEVGKMKEARNYHAVSTIQMDNELMDLCN